MQTVTIRIGEQDLVLETGRMAKQANGAIFATYAGTAVLATATCSDEPREGLDFVPLSVEYNEKYYAAGKIPGGFLKREGRPKDKEVLVCRLIDRPMRPLFSKKFMRELQIVPTTISADRVNPPDVIAMVAASAAVHISDIPFDGPVGAVRVCSIQGELVVNPTFDQIAKSELEIIVAGTKDGITMVEGGAREVGEELMLAAIDKARDVILDICRAQDELRELAGKEKLPLVADPPPLAIADDIRAFATPLYEEACFVTEKMARQKAVKAAKEKSLEHFAEALEDETHLQQAKSLLGDIQQEVVRRSILEKKYRNDGRSLEDIRKITCETNLLPRTHGSALFTRGETQALAVVTLGTMYDEQIMDDIDGDRRENFMLHYNFPPFSVGETGRLGTGRREIGHGHLAHRALEGVLPGKEAFPYTLRLVSEILESNGSSSMATVCAGSLALMSAGVPIKKPVAGIAMGLITEGDSYAVLSDILGDEDHLGDMDFKVTGTDEGITAFQMDIKIKNVSPEIMKAALDQAKRGRMHILEKMGEEINRPQEELSEHAPRIITFKVDPDEIGLLIGSGGKTVKAISEKFGVQVNFEDSGNVTIYSKDKAAADQAKSAFEQLLVEPEIGVVYPGIVKRITDFGAFIEFLPSREGLCHISKMSAQRINSVEDVLSMGQEVDVKIVEIDKMGRVNLSLIYEGMSEGGPSRGPDRGPDRGPRPSGNRGGRDGGGRGGSRDRGGRRD
ncbi:polyribonucleotide nucleotidyltransferase [Alkalispirochaeta sphaeroplastigenens]|uniref:Polyribonucleotide nucleotidyltransferase n=1 Tax=Alkalispirochaeta sphaeroplastigenens TaxID=1187066 RepID=A0A2S4JFD6_9SPIO|nr:polyribonucleotide nucleotidyltransferase [Alkalispirochaeta sphaeroplastigenens]POQ98233.1 polyribonucleotide nucleotidyltransferase [Alkalispirochaeta sphaeroplastigenens]